MKKKILCMLLALVMIVGAIGTLSACGKKDDGGTKTCENGKHTDADKNNVCDVCKEKIEASTGKCKHVDTDPKDGKCDKCDEKMEDDKQVIEYPWEETTLLFKYTNNSNNDELSSACARYLAGVYDGETDELDDLVLMRNADALTTTKVNVKYDYYDESAAYQWSSAVKAMVQELDPNSNATCADIYCNFVYDMVATSLNGCFANLLSTQYGQGELKGKNYFAFTSDDYLEDGQEFPDPEDDMGYMYEYMRSTTLSKYKMYILSSDYFTDMVRGFFIVPVNISLLEQIGEKVCGDLDDSGEFDIDDFYKEINQNKWTYTRLAEYAKEFSSSVDTVQSLHDTVGFALSTGGLASSGIVYSTNVTVVKRDWSAEDNDYTYSYPDENNDLYTFVDNLKVLFEQPGVVAVYNNFSDYGTSSLLAIRKRFSENFVLFGGIECVGALEEPEYNALKSGTGFGVAPVPLYEPVEEGDTTTYLTSVHNIGRPGAISAKTRYFAQCTAFLDYQSQNSADILEMYYTLRIQYGATNGERGTVDMLDFIRNNVRSSFDKTMEDAIGYKYNTGDERWHSIIGAGKFQIDIRESYLAYIGDKQDNLEALRRSYDDYPG